MNSISKIIVISLCITFAACSDKQEKNIEDSKRHVSSAKVYQEQGQYRAAIIEAKNAIQLMPESPEGYISLARIYNEIGASSATQSMLSPIVDKLPEVSTELANAHFLNRKYLTAINTITSYPADASRQEDRQRQSWLNAMSNIYLGNREGYEIALKEFVAVGGKESEAKFITASYLVSKGEIENAKVVLTEVLEAEPENVDVLFTMANVSLYLKDLEGAERNLTQALGQLKKTDIINTKRSQIISLLTDVLIQLGRTSEAYTYQKLLAESNPEGSAAQQRFNDAMELYQQGKYAEAEVILRELREQFPNDKNTGTLLGLIEYQQGSNRKAEDLFDEFIDPETVTPSVLQAAALVKFRNNQIDDAVALLKKSADSQPNNPVVLATYGLALLDKDPKSSEGVIVLEKSLALDPRQQRIRIALANRHIALGQQEQAVAQLQKAYQEQPDDFYIQQSYFKALLGNEQSEKLEEEINRYKDKNPDSSRGYFFDGWYQFQQKNYKAAEQQFERAIAVSDSREKNLAYAGLAQLYEAQDQVQKSITAWQFALQEDPGMVVGYSRWLAQMRKLNRDSDALVFLNGLEEKTLRWEPSIVLAQLYASMKELGKAIKHAELALERSNQNANVKQLTANLYRVQGVQFRSQNKLPEARESLMKAVKLQPENASFLGNLIETEIAAKNIPEAQKLLDQFIKVPENEGERLFLQGLIRFAEDKKEEGIQLYLDSWSAKPMESVAEQIFAYYQKADDKSKAEEFLSSWIEKIPESKAASLMMAVTAQGKNNMDDALTWYEKSVALNPNMPAALNNLAWLYYERKDPRALEYAKKAYEMAPNSAPIADTYGWILVERGELAKGIEILSKAVQLEPDNKEIIDHLKEAKSRQ
ncbi:tetratricopeptide repeat protein [Cellvibrio sp. pealriver]|uniref:tetratricopeptide repeat protein n=1 Tax=Cellvibrio sp. pealriver TaxID=1622269 RepID=UPI00066FDDE6|nr:tetratricopeptide repeat protein [Cellvibrio sp. pealriver]